jgi:hypothetical protein
MSMQGNADAAYSFPTPDDHDRSRSGGRADVYTPLLSGCRLSFLCPLVVHLCLCVLVLSLALVGPVALFAVCDWLIRMGRRRFPRGQSLIPETRTGPKRGGRESVG